MKRLHQFPRPWARMRRAVAIGLFCSSAPFPALAQYSGAFGCTEDCSGHQAGYAWAQQRDISDPSFCGGRSTSFIEGCMDYAEQRQREMREDAGCDVDDDTCDAE
jgi:hypothetical protein